MHNSAVNPTIVTSVKIAFKTQHFLFGALKMKSIINRKNSIIIKQNLKNINK